MGSTMKFPPFEHAAWLARAWEGTPPQHNLASSGFDSPVLAELLDGVHRDDLHHMDLSAGIELRHRIAQRHGLDGAQVRVTSGTTLANTAILMLSITPGCNVVCERPTYAPMAALAQGLGAQVRWVDRGAVWDLDAVAAACDDDTAAIICTSPNNPTGHSLSAADFDALGDIAQRHGAIVLADQVYRELTDHTLGATVHPAVLSTSGLNKCWGAGGLRIGWAVSTPEWANRIEEMQRLLATAPSAYGLRMAHHLLDHEARCKDALATHLDGAHRIYADWARGMGLDETALGLTAFPAIDADADALLAQGIAAVPGALFHKPGHLRIGFGVAHAPLQSALEALGSALSAQRF